MYLYKLSQTFNKGWDTYDSCVVVAADEESAKLISPCGYYSEWSEEKQDWLMTCHDGMKVARGTYQDWARPDQIKVEYVGTAADGLTPGTVVCASFNAG